MLNVIKSLEIRNIAMCLEIRNIALCRLSFVSSCELVLSAMYETAEVEGHGQAVGSARPAHQAHRPQQLGRRGHRRRRALPRGDRRDRRQRAALCRVGLGLRGPAHNTPGGSNACLGGGDAS